MTTHDLARGLANCDQVAILAEGRIAFQTRREEIDTKGLVDVYDRTTQRRRAA